MNNMKKLKDLVNIRSGYTFRAAIDSFPVGDVEVVQSKDLNDDFNFATRPKIDFLGDKYHLLKPGDILFTARGYAKAMLYRDEKKRAVASSSLFILKPKNNIINASFLVMYLNSPDGMKEFIRLSSGSSIKTITKNDLGNIEIPEIPPDKQDALGGLVQAINDYRMLNLEKQIYLDQIQSTIISKTLKETTK